MPEPTISPSWVDLINKSVHASDDIDVGDIYAISREFLVVKRGFVNIHYYYVPINTVEGWDGHILWLKINEAEVKEKYEKDYVPDPSSYYLKNNLNDVVEYCSKLAPIPSKLTKRTSITSPYATSAPRIYKCNRCNASLKTDDELITHIDYHY